MRQSAFAVAILFSLVAITGCDRSSTTTADPSAASQTPQQGLPESVAEEQPVVLEDLVEATSDYLVGISYQGDATRYPGLAKQLKLYADTARDEMIQSARARPRGEDTDTSNVPYDLSLSFVKLMETPDLVAFAADGSSYTGGAHGMPLLARFSWLPKEQKMLTANDLVTDQAGWNAISAHVREQLHTQLTQRVDADKPSPQERASMIRSAGRMIDDGTAAEPVNFAQFEPLVGTSGKLRGLRFVFSPYQVGPYSDGVQSVEVPASMLLPYIAPEYRHLFQDGGS